MRLADPVAVKELSGSARRLPTYVGRVLYVGLIAVVLFGFWRERGGSGSGFRLSPSEYAEIGRSLFEALLWLQMTFVTLAAIAAAADQIPREVRAGTLGLLLLTPLTPRAIAAGKWKAAMAQAASLVFCGVPAMAICVYLGGAGPWEVAWSTALTLACAALGAGFSLRYSSMYASATRAIVMSILALVAYTLLPILPACVAGEAGLLAVCWLHPLYATLGAIHGFRISQWVSYGWIGATSLSFIVGWALARAAAARIEKRVTAPPRPDPIDRGFATGSSYHSVDPRTGRARLVVRKGVWEERPLLWKELATRAAGRVSGGTRFALFILFGFMLLCLWGASEGKSAGTFLFIASIFALFAVTTGAALFAPEKEGRRLEMLLSTPVTAGQIVRAKLLSGLVAPESIGAITLWALSVLLFTWWGFPRATILYGMVSGTFLAFAYALAGWASLRARTMRGAFLFAAAVLLALLVGGAWAADTLSRPPRWVEGVLQPGRLLMEDRHASYLGFRSAVWITDSWQPYAAFFAAYGLGALILVALTALSFDRVAGRA